MSQREPVTGERPAGRPGPDLAAVMRAWARTMAAVGAATGPFFGDLEITTAQLRVLGQLSHHGRVLTRDWLSLAHGCSLPNGLT